jgi:integrase
VRAAHASVTSAGQPGYAARAPGWASRVACAATARSTLCAVGAGWVRSHRMPASTPSRPVTIRTEKVGPTVPCPRPVPRLRRHHPRHRSDRYHRVRRHPGAQAQATRPDHTERRRNHPRDPHQPARRTVEGRDHRRRTPRPADHSPVSDQSAYAHPAGRGKPANPGSQRRPPRQVPPWHRQGPSVRGEGRQGRPRADVRPRRPPRRDPDQPVRDTGRLRKPRRKVVVLTDEHLHAVRAAIRTWQQPVPGKPGPRHTGDLADIVDLMLATGARIGEILALRWEDLDLAATGPTLTICGTWSRSKATASSGRRGPKVMPATG